MSVLRWLRRVRGVKFTVWYWLSQPNRMYWQWTRDRQKKGSPT